MNIPMIGADALKDYSVRTEDFILSRDAARRSSHCCVSWNLLELPCERVARRCITTTSRRQYLNDANNPAAQNPVLKRRTKASIPSDR